MCDKYYWKIVFIVMIETYSIGEGIKSKYKILLIIAWRTLCMKIEIIKIIYKLYSILPIIFLVADLTIFYHHPIALEFFNSCLNEH